MAGLKDKVAVVTGASEGIGEAIVRRLAAEGMKVAALARRGEMLKALETELKSKGCIVKGYVCDVRKESNVKATFKNIEEDFGRLNVLVNNAAYLKHMPLRDLNIEDSKNMFNTNIIGVLSCTKEALSSFKNCSVDHAHIVNINSIAGQRDFDIEEIAIYSATKRALTSLCTSFRNELKSSKIRVTSISPGLVKTSMAATLITNYPDWPYLLLSDVADAVFYAISAPSNVNVSEIILDNI